LKIKVSPQIENVSAQKWYGQKFHEFRTTFKAPPDLIRTIHEAKKDLIDVFYPEQYQEILNDQLIRYGEKPIQTHKAAATKTGHNRTSSP
jgi:hypothetical protein